VKPFGGNPPKFAGMDKPTFTAAEQFAEAAKAADALATWLRRVMALIAAEHERRAMEAREWH